MGLLQIFDPTARPTPVGIDLGTTNSLVAWVVDGRPQCVLDCDNLPLLPSIVTYLPNGEILVGEAARRAGIEHPRQTIASVKRFMGRGGDDPVTQRRSSNIFVSPHEGESNVVRFRVNDQIVTPVEVSAEILKSLGERAADKLGPLGGAVITVPAYFDDAQRQATRDAGRLAGLEVLRLLNEPTAAALAYGLDRGKTRGTFAVFDLGGGTFDITILSLDDGVFQVRSTGGDSQLGGDDMDRAVVQWLSHRAGFALETAAPGQIRSIHEAARAAKHALTEQPDVEISLDDVMGRHTRVVLHRTDFDAIVRPVVEKTGIACRRALRDAGLSGPELDGVVLVGGSTRVPFVRTYVESLFRQTPLSDVDPEQVVALGAAIQADILAGTQQNEALVLDVIPLSLGIETMGGVAEKILPRNSSIPGGRSQEFTTYADNQTGFEVHVVQGERELVRDCRSLAKFTLRGIPPMPAGMARLVVSFHVDANGLLSVSAKEKLTGIEQKVDVTPSYGLTDEDVEKMILDSFEHAAVDLVTRQKVERTVEARRVIAATEDALSKDADLLDTDELDEVRGALAALGTAIERGDVHAIGFRTEAVDRATTPLAERRMNRAITQAMAGKAVADIENKVRHASGVEAHLESHEARNNEG